MLYYNSHGFSLLYLLRLHIGMKCCIFSNGCYLISIVTFVFQALLLDESSEKALFRRGEALVAMKEFDQAREDFQQVVQLYPANKAAKAQVRLELVEPISSPTLRRDWRRCQINWGIVNCFLTALHVPPSWVSVRNTSKTSARRTSVSMQTCSPSLLRGMLRWATWSSLPSPTFRWQYIVHFN